MKFEPNYVAAKEAIKESRNFYKYKMKPLMYTKIVDLDYEVLKSKEPIAFKDIKKDKFIKIPKNKSWGKDLFDCAWFHVYKNLEGFKFDEETYIEFDINGEALLVDKYGEPLKGFTNGSSAFSLELGDPAKKFYPIYNLIEGNKLDLYFDCGYNDLFGNIQENGLVKTISLVERNEKMCKVCYDFDVLLTLLENIDFKNKYFDTLFKGINDVKDLFLYNNKDAVDKAIVILDSLLSIKENTTKSLPVMHAVGHAHLDLGWLWPIRESKRKAVRTLTNVFYLLEKYPDFHFVISQPQQLIWIKENEPNVFKKIQEYEKIGRIEIVGGGFVEFDTNVSGEEELVRQVFYGQKFYLENFGHYVNNLWLPDTFGYNGNLPQIVKQGGMDYFVTIKISWNRFNTFPFHNIMWEGIDGTKVLAHFPLEGTYNSGASPKSLIDGNKLRTKYDKNYDSLMIYGIGDGGGGPGEEHVENIKRIDSLMGLNSVKNDSVNNFFEVLNKSKDELPVYKGELYLENHNGTYTSQSFNKQYNRKIEEKIKRLEMYLSLNGIHDFDDQVDELYRRILLLEFHDILPGSSIKRVYDESKIEYLSVEKTIDDIFKKVIKGYKKEYQDNLFVFNHLNYKFSKLFKFNNAYYQVDMRPIKNNKFSVVYNKENDINSNVLETKNVIVTFNKKGYIDSIFYKKANKEIVLNGANKLVVYQDLGDGWNIREDYRNQDEVLMDLSSRKITKYGPIYEVVSEYKFSNSKVTETMIINDEDIITFKHDVDWQDNKYMLRSNFNLNVNSDFAICDIQFGNVKRTRKNETLQETAQFEVCAQQYVDIYDKEVGVALINKTKCGYYIKNNDLELNLLRSTNYPCVNGDIGKTSYEYALYLHVGDYKKANVDKIAYIFNSDFIMSSRRMKTLTNLYFKNDDLEYSCIKNKYKDKGIIIRLYERSGRKTKLNLNKLGFKDKKISLVNFIEEVVVDDVSNSIIEFKPFEVKTFWIH